MSWPYPQSDRRYRPFQVDDTGTQSIVNEAQGTRHCGALRGARDPRTPAVSVLPAVSIGCARVRDLCSAERARSVWRRSRRPEQYTIYYTTSRALPGLLIHH